MAPDDPRGDDDNSIPVNTPGAGGGTGPDGGKDVDGIHYEDRPTIVKNYKADEPLVELEEVLQERYDSISVGAATPDMPQQQGQDPFQQMMGGQQIPQNPRYGIEDSESYPSDLEIIVEDEDLDDPIELVVQQGEYLSPQAMMGQYNDDEDGYELAIEATGWDRDELEEVFAALDEEYGELLEDISEAEEAAEQMQAQMEMQGMGMQDGEDGYSEFETDVSSYTWQDIALPDGLEDEIKTYTEGPLENPELYEKVGRKPKGVVVHGKPGTGKTLLAKVVASESEATFMSASIAELTSMFHGESSSQVDRLFDYAKEESPSIIYLDEADSLLRSRGGGSGSPTTDQIREDMVNTFLDNMDGIEELDDVMVIASTNRREAMDDAAVRDERFDAIFELPEPTEEARKQIFEIHTEDEAAGAFGDLDYDELAAVTEDWTGAEIAGAVERAKVNAIQELHEEYGEFADIPPEELVIEQEDLLETIGSREGVESVEDLRYIR